MTATLALFRGQLEGLRLGRGITPYVDAATCGARAGFVLGLRTTADALDQAADMETNATRAAALREAATVARGAADTEEKRS